jgi:tRNA(Ile)-lysidine synthetase-like protein
MVSPFTVYHALLVHRNGLIRLHDIIKSMKPLVSSTPEDRVLLAVSGGVDSMVLLAQYQNTASRVVHFNYHTRAESDQDEAFVLAQSTTYGLPCTVIHVPVLDNGNFQEQARTFRYDILSDIAKTQGYNCVLLGHHQDDAAETLLMQLLRGTSLPYLGLNDSLTWNGVPFKRPLLSFRKSELVDYAITHNIKFVEDSSNQKNDYLRNRIRHTIIPALLKEQPVWHDKVLEYGRQASQLLSYLNQQTQALFESTSRTLFQESAPILQEHTLRRWCHAHHIEPHQTLLQDMHRLIVSPTAQTKLQLSPELWMIVTYDTIAFEPREILVAINIEINAPGEYPTPNHGIVIVSTIEPEQNKNRFEFTEDDLPFPLQWRTRLPGDQLQMSYGHKSLSDWLMERKVPQSNRDRLQLLAKNNEILWIPSLQWKKEPPLTPHYFITIEDTNNETTS